MTREQAKDLLPIIHAFAEGKTIQYQNTDKNWVDIESPSFNYEPSLYRIKPESKYRPFKNTDECWEEMHKHSDFGWVYEKANSKYHNIIGISNNIYGDIEIIGSVCFTTSFERMFMDFQFIDGSPFGIKEE